MKPGPDQWIVIVRSNAKGFWRYKLHNSFGKVLRSGKNFSCQAAAAYAAGRATAAEVQAWGGQWPEIVTDWGDRKAC
jgi:hypothetical protein